MNKAAIKQVDIERIDKAMGEEMEKIIALNEREEEARDDANTILLMAQEAIERRRVSHGDIIKNLGCIAKLWTAFLQLKHDNFPPLAAKDIATMMELLKIGRRESGAFNEDDYADAAGYVACAYECGKNEK